MLNPELSPRRMRFGPFEIDRRTREIRKFGAILKLHDQSFQLLSLLLETPGELVEREFLQKSLWPDGVFVDYDQGLNKAAHKLRIALSDTADKPRYIETVARRGYRFVAAVDVEKAVEREEPQVAPRRRQLGWWACAAATTFAAVTLATGLWPIPVPTVERIVQLTNDGLPKPDFLIVDGPSVLYSVVNHGRIPELWQVLATGGEPKRVNLSFLEPETGIWVCGYSPSTQKMLLGSSKGEQVIYWIMGTDGSAPRIAARTGFPSDAQLSPDGTRISLALLEGLFIQTIDSGQRTTLYARKGTTQSTPTTIATWHPSGRRLAFSEVGNDLSTVRLLQVDADGRNLRRMIPDWEEVQSPGTWSPDGKRFYFTSPLAKGEVWVRAEPGLLGWLRQPRLQRLTISASNPNMPVADPTNMRRLFLTEKIGRGETQRWNLKSGGWEPFRPGFSGEGIEYSPDRKMMAYVDFPKFRLYRCGSDGSGAMELAPGVDAYHPRWSPDGQTIAFAGKKAGSLEPFRVWTVPSSGGHAAPLTAIPGPGFDPTWSPDGKKIVFAPNMWLRPASEHAVQILDLETGKVEAVPGGERKFSTRWSPDGTMISALNFGDRGTFLWVYRFQTKQWTQLTDQQFGFQEWSKDSKYIYGAVFDPTPQWPQPVRVEVSTKKLDIIALRPSFPLTANLMSWIGWTPEMEPLCLRDMTRWEIFRIDLDR